MQIILIMFITLISVILAGISNMIFCKSSLCQALNRPMDGGRLWQKDQKRIFGANKTWKGFWGMVVFATGFQILWGWVSQAFPILEQYNYIYQYQRNTTTLNALVGFALGFAYVLFELPNSFIKRRLDIAPGKQANNALRWLFIAIDQTDSLFGCTLVLAVLFPMSLAQYLAFVILGGVTHIVINVILYRLKLRRNLY